MKMKCEVIRDLLPSYIDGLTSKESNEVIEEHLDECAGCREYLKEMQEEVDVPDVRRNQKAIRPFRKLKRQMKKRIFMAAGIAVLVCGAVFGGGAWYYGHTWLANSSDVKMSIDASGGIVTLKFTPKEGTVLHVETEEKEDNTIVITEGHRNPLKKNYQKSAYYGFTFTDEETVMGLNGKSSKIDEDDVLTIKYENKTETISMQELAQRAMENPVADSENVKMTYNKDDHGRVTLGFYPTLVGVFLKVEETGENAILIRQYYENKGETEESGDVYTMSFLDSDTILLPDGTTKNLTGSETLEIEYQDKTEKIPFEKLWNGDL